MADTARKKGKKLGTKLGKFASAAGRMCGPRSSEPRPGCEALRA